MKLCPLAVRLKAAQATERALIAAAWASKTMTKQKGREMRCLLNCFSETDCLSCAGAVGGVPGRQDG